jgi:hypothetical protein
MMNSDEPMELFDRKVVDDNHRIDCYVKQHPNGGYIACADLFFTSRNARKLHTVLSNGIFPTKREAAEDAFRLGVEWIGGKMSQHS